MTEPKDYICKDCRAKLYGKLEKCPLCGGELVVFKGKEPKKMSDNTPNRTSIKKFRIILALLLIMIPIKFVWHIELMMTPRIPYLTNGFFNFNSSQVYHILMYLLFISNFIGAYYLIKGAVQND